LLFFCLSDLFPFVFFYYRCKAEGKREGLFAKISKSILKEIGFFPNLVVERMAGCEGREIAG